MDERVGLRIDERVHNRSPEIAAAWYGAVASTGYPDLSAVQVRVELRELVKRLGSLLSADHFDPQEAEAIGSALPQLRFSSSECLGRTLEVLASELVQGLEPLEVASIQPRLAQILARMAAGFGLRADEIMLRDQEEIRSALVSELRQAHTALADAFAGVERQVQQRTSELAGTNARLQREIEERARAQKALQEAERTARVLLNAPSAIVILLDAEGVVLDANEAARRRFGQPGSSLIGADVWGLFPEPVAERRREAVQAVLNSGRPLRLEDEQDGIIRDTTIVPILDQAGKVTRLAVHAHDITQLKSTERRLKESLQLTDRAHGLLSGLSQAMRSVQQAHTPQQVYEAVGQELRDLGYHALVLELTGDGAHLTLRYVSTSPRVVQLAERMARQTVGAFAFAVPEDGLYARLLVQSWGTFLEGKEIQQLLAESLPQDTRGRSPRLARLLGVERVIVTPYGSAATPSGLLVVGGADLQPPDTNPISVFAGQMAIALDNARLYQETVNWAEELEQRVQARAADLSASEARYRTLFERGTEALFIFDMDGRYIDINETACGMTGYSREELLQMSVFQLQVGDDQLDSLERSEQLQEARSLWRQGAAFEVQLRTSDGHAVPVEVVVTPLTYLGREAVLGAARDISDRKQAQERLARSERRLRRQYERLPLPTYTWQRVGDRLELIDYNEAAQRAAGGEMESLRGRDDASIMGGTPELRKAMWQCVNQRSSAEWEGTHRYLTTGRERRLVAHIAFVPPDRVVVHTEDITERDQAAREVRQARRDAERANALLLALSQAGQAVQRARATEEVQESIGSELRKLGYSATVLEVTADQTALILRYTTNEHVLVRVARQILGRGMRGLRVPLAPDGFFAPLLSRSDTLFCPSMVDLVGRAFPSVGRALLEKTLTKLGLERSIHAPMVMGGRVRRVLSVLGSDLTEADVPAVTVFAHQAAIALENAALLQELSRHSDQLRSLAQRVVSAQEEERRALSLALHDEAGQSLTALGISLQLMQQDLDDGPQTDLRQRLADAAALSRETLEHLRLMAQDLRPPVLDTLGLDHALGACCRDFARRTGMAIEYGSAVNVEATDAVSVCLYRLLQEALTNAARHARATEVRVVLRAGISSLVLSVEDDGMGFDPEILNHGDHSAFGLGLVGIRERLQMLGGRLEIMAAPGQGTRVVGSVPLLVAQRM